MLLLLAEVHVCYKNASPCIVLYSKDDFQTCNSIYYTGIIDKSCSSFELVSLMLKFNWFHKKNKKFASLFRKYFPVEAIAAFLLMFHLGIHPANIYLFKVNNRNVDKICNKSSKLKKWHQNEVIEVFLLSSVEISMKSDFVKKTP